MKLSIIIPLYNKEKFVDRCLKSLLVQDLPTEEYEIIVVNDGSTDNSATIVENYVQEYNNVLLFHQQNGGAGAARNKGLEVSNGDYVYFLDADDYLAANVLNQLLVVAEHNNLEILGFNSMDADDGSLTESIGPQLQDVNLPVMDGVSYIAKHRFRNEAWWYIIERSFLLDVGITFTEGRFLQDSIFTASLLLKTNKISKGNLDIHRFVKVENSATTNKKPAHILKFIDDLVYAIEQFDLLIKSLDSSNLNYQKVLEEYKRKQQSFVFTLFLKAFRCSALSFKDLKKILSRLNELDTYPLDRKIGGIGNSKTRYIYTLLFFPIFNNKALLFLSLKIKRLFFS